VLDVIANALSFPADMEIIGVDEIWKNGIAIPVKRVIRDETSVFPIQEYDWDDIRERVNPLVVNVIKKALASTFS
jgi:hypothetical protein